MKALITLLFLVACSHQAYTPPKELQAKLIAAEKAQEKQKREWSRKPSSLGVKLKRIEIKDEEDRPPTWLYVPKKYSKKKKWPLVISLHGYRGMPFFQEILVPFLPYVNKKGFFLAIPKGLKDKKGQRYWNGAGCCDFDKRNQNDVGHLRELINEINIIYNIDPSKVFLFGHSNGGFMSYKMACEASDIISGIVSWAGSTYLDPKECKNANPVTILQIHGKKDNTIKYLGAKDWHPSAEDTIKQWAEFDECSVKYYSENKIKGAKAGLYRTLDQKIWTNCKGGKKVALWTSEKGGHTYLLGTQLTKNILDFLF